MIDATPVTTPDPESDAAEVRARVAAAVRERRVRRGASLAELAAAAGIGKSTLHAIESGDANPSIETLWALARALGVAFGELLDPPAPTVRVVRAGEGPHIETADGGGLLVHLLTSTGRGARVEWYAMTFGEGPPRAAEAHPAGTVEHLLVIAGRLRTGPTDEQVELAAGDLATFPGDVPHRYEALEPATRALLLLEYR